LIDLSITKKLINCRCALANGIKSKFKILKMAIILLELFSGTGGFALGLHQAGFKFKHHFFSEVDNHAISNYKYNFKNAKYIGSVKHVRYIIRTINQFRQPTDELIITFGSPCQDFSLAGKRGGLDGEKSSLIKYALFLIKWLKPSVYIWENVKGTFSSNNGADFWAIIKAFAHIGGYNIEWQLLNTLWFLPQNRERIYLIGHAGTGSFTQVFPITENDSLFTKPQSPNQRWTQAEYSKANALTAQSHVQADGTFIQVPHHANTITGGAHSGGLHSDMTVISYTRDSKGVVTNYHEKNHVNTLHSASGGGGNTDCFVKCCSVRSRSYRNQEAQLEVRQDDATNTITSVSKDNYVLIKSNTNQGFETANIGDSVNYSNLNSTTRRGRVGKKHAQTIDMQANQAVVVTHYGHKDKPAEFRESVPTLKSESHGHTPMVLLDDVLLRRLTEIECERVHGFPDDWTKHGITETNEVKEISATQRYKMLGNAVSPIVVQAIGKRLLPSFN
jgi:DNA (cytosine-5)-methyltransferase 1